MEFSYISIVSSLLVLLSFYLFVRNLKNLVFGKKEKNLPPGPSGLPILGNLLSLGDRPHEALEKMAKIHGPLMTVRIGLTNTLVVSSPEMAKQVLQIHDQVFAGRPTPDAVTAQNDYQLSMAWQSAGAGHAGDGWRSLRKLLNTQIFTNHRLDAMQDLRQRMNEEMVNRLVEASKESEAIDIGKLVFRSSVILLSNTMFSGDLVDTKSNTIEVLKDTIEHIGTLIAKPNSVDSFPMLKKLDPQGLRKNVKPCYDRIRFLLEDLIDRRLKRRESGSSNGGDFLDILLDNSVLTPGGSEELSRNQIRMILQDLLIGGTDTTTTTMEWAMTELLHHPEIMKKAKQELSRVIGSGRNVQEKDITNLPYLEAVIKEAMRRHPTAPFLLPHRSEKQVQVCGYTIPKHTQVIINYWAISQDEKNWENPKEFVPERFLRAEVDFRGTNFSYIPFGSGRRICPGMSLGIRMLFLMLGSFVHRFDWKLPNGMKAEDMDLGDKFGIDLQKATPLVATPVFLN